MPQRVTGTVRVSNLNEISSGGSQGGATETTQASVLAAAQAINTAVASLLTATNALNSKTVEVDTGAVTVSNQLAQPLTDSQLRASAVPVSIGQRIDLNEEIAQLLSGFIQELKYIGNVISYPPYTDRSQNRIRGTVAVESGTISTVSVLTGLTNIDSYPGRMLINGMDFDAWNNSVGKRFS